MYIFTPLPGCYYYYYFFIEVLFLTLVLIYVNENL